MASAPTHAVGFFAPRSACALRCRAALLFALALLRPPPSAGQGMTPRESSFVSFNSLDSTVANYTFLYGAVVVSLSVGDTLEAGTCNMAGSSCVGVCPNSLI